MGSLGLISFLVALVAIPLAAARQPDPATGARMMLVGVFVASLLYAAFAAFVYSSYYRPEIF
jgi:hypothetical protein